MKPNDKAIEAALLAAKTVLRNDEITIDSAIFAAVNAAYAAQFQSEDYAGLVEGLRHSAILGRPFVMEPNGWVAGYEKAADALEALLAERDALKSELIDYKDAAESEADFVNEQAEKIRKLKAECESLAAVTAERDSLREVVKRADSYIHNGIELGFIRHCDTPEDPAYHTPRIVREAARAALEGVTEPPR